MPRPRFRPDPGPCRPIHPFCDRARKQRFLELVRARLGRDGDAVTIRDGVAWVARSAARHGLSNLARTCDRSPSERWQALIDEHFAKSDFVSAPGVVASLLADDYAAAAPQLAIRIHPSEWLDAAMLPHVVHRVDLPGTREERGAFVAYEGEWMDGAIEREATVLADGGLLETAHELTADQIDALPAAVCARIAELRADGGAVTVSRREFVFYDIDVVRGDEQREYLVRPDGADAATPR